MWWQHSLLIIWYRMLAFIWEQHRAIQNNPMDKGKVLCSTRSMNMDKYHLAQLSVLMLQTKPLWRKKKEKLLLRKSCLDLKINQNQEVIPVELTTRPVDDMVRVDCGTSERQQCRIQFLANFCTRTKISSSAKLSCWEVQMGFLFVFAVHCDAWKCS